MAECPGWTKAEFESAPDAITRLHRRGLDLEAELERLRRIEKALTEFEALDYRKRRAVSSDALAEFLRSLGSGGATASTPVGCGDPGSTPGQPQETTSA